MEFESLITSVSHSQTHSHTRTRATTHTHTHQCTLSPPFSYNIVCTPPPPSFKCLCRFYLLIPRRFDQVLAAFGRISISSITQSVPFDRPADPLFAYIPGRGGVGWEGHRAVSRARATASTPNKHYLFFNKRRLFFPQREPPPQPPFSRAFLPFINPIFLQGEQYILIFRRFNFSFRARHFFF